MKLLTQYKQYLKLIIIVFPVLLIIGGCGSKEGCMDPAALNFDSKAKIDNGTCKYSDLSLKPVELSKLDNMFNENSGLAYDGQRLWTITDGGGENKVYSINFSTGNPLEEIELLDVSNVDYEAISIWGGRIFVGDFGNNEGDREDLVIYRFNVPSPLQKENAVQPENIFFDYPEQVEFDKNEKTPFDAEAMVPYNGKLYVFTKDHSDFTTSMYELPMEPGKHSAVLKGKFDSEGLITDAAISPNGQRLVLVGNDGTSIFAWVFFKYNDHLFDGEKIKIVLGDITTVGQVEGASFFNNESFFISNENGNGKDPWLALVDISNLYE